MQAVYFLNSGIKLEKNECFSLVSNHDEFSFWFQVQNSSIHESEILRPVCQCCFHFLLSRARIGGMNDEMRRICYLKTMERVLTKETVCIILGDISLLAPLSANLGAKKVYAVSEIPSVEKVYKMLLAENNLADVLSVRSNILQVVKRLDQELVNESFDVLIVSEPYFRHSILPWDNLAFWYAKEELINSIKHMNQVKSIKTLPTKGRLRGCAVQFDNLWRIARPLNTCEGFSMKIFDNLIAEAKEKVENYVEPQSLWEYPGIALSLPLTFFEFDFNDDIPKEKIKKQGEIQLQFAGRCDGVALWMEYNLSKDYSLSFGPTETVVAGQYITWDLYEKQGVHLFRTPSNVNVGNLMFYDSEFDPHEAEINFHFHFEALEKP